jgi:hypothetical protein
MPELWKYGLDQRRDDVIVNKCCLLIPNLSRRLWNNGPKIQPLKKSVQRSFRGTIIYYSNPNTFTHTLN